MKASAIPTTEIHWRGTYRLVPTRYPSVGILDTLTIPEDLEAIQELEGWTNDRISNELGILHRLPKEEWVIGRPMSTVIMAAFCHPRATGSRFSNSERGAWYASRTLDTAHAEVIYHRTKELDEVGILDARVQLCAYQADFSAAFHDIRQQQAAYRPFYDPDSYEVSQELAVDLLDAGSHGIVYRSVRHEGGECIACFRPGLIRNVRPGAYFEYQWSGQRTPAIRRLTPPVRVGNRGNR